MSTTTQTKWVIFESIRTHHLSLKAQKCENPIFTFKCFYLKAVYNSIKLQRLLYIAKFLIMYSFTHTNIVLHFSHLPTEIAIFMSSFVTRWSVSVVIVFAFLGAVFANIAPTFLISCEIKRYSKTLTYSEPHIWDHLEGIKVKIWICS